MMPRYRLVLEYDGSPFAGWQRQDGVLTVQEVIETAAASIAEAPVIVFGAGRTDSGVHATGQVAHLDLPRALRPDKVKDALNARMRPHPVAVLSANAVDDTFHARFSAIGRRYLYRIINRRADLALERGRAWRVGQRLDSAAMHAAAQALVGKHDFSTFRDSQCQAESPVKTLDWIRVSQVGEEIAIGCAAPSFLHRQVRSIVGSLVEVGRGRQQPEWMGEILAAADRAACGPVSPPDGLYLAEVMYPDTAPAPADSAVEPQ